MIKISVPPGRFVVVLIAILVFLTCGLMGTKTTQAAEIRVAYPGIGVDATVAIQRALNDSKYSRVILDYQPEGWVTGPLFMNTPSQELWLAGIGLNSNRLLAKPGSFLGQNDCLIRIQAPGCTINGYNNGTNTEAGRGIMEMRRADYTKAPYRKGEWRHGISSDQSNATIKGVEVRHTGGDGIYINGGYMVAIKDVVCDAAYRNGLSIIRVNGMTIDDSVFKNTKGTSPEAGIDFEPNFATESISNVKVNRCLFENNAIRQVLVTIHQLTDGGTLGITFNSCTMIGGQYGAWIAGSHPTGPAGNVIFNDSTIKDSSKSAIFVQKWSADRVPIILNKGTITNSAHGGIALAPIEIHDGGVDFPVGNVHFRQTWRIADSLARPYVIGGTAKAYGYKNITSALPLEVQRLYDAGASPLVKFTSEAAPSNLTLTAKPIP